MNFGQAGICNKLQWLTLFKQSYLIFFSLFSAGFYLLFFEGFKIIFPIKGLWSRWVLQNYDGLHIRFLILIANALGILKRKHSRCFWEVGSFSPSKEELSLAITPAEFTVNVVLPMISQNCYFCANRFKFFTDCCSCVKVFACATDVFQHTSIICAF